MNIILILLTIIGVSFLFSISFLAPLTLSYAIRENKILLLFLKTIPIGWVSFNNIKEIKKYDNLTSGEKNIFLPARWQNKPLGENILIEKKRGLFKYILITPDNIDEFIREVAKQITG